MITKLRTQQHFNNQKTTNPVEVPHRSLIVSFVKKNKRDIGKFIVDVLICFRLLLTVS